MKRSFCIITVLVAALAAGCALSPITRPIGPLPQASTELGELTFSVHWPGSRLAQALPFVTTKLAFTIESPSGETVAHRTLAQGESAVSVSLPSCTGYKLHVQADAATQPNIAGAEATFSILRNRSTDLAVELAPIIKRFAGSPLAAGAGAAERSALLNMPEGIWCDGSDLLVANNLNNTIGRIDPAGNISVVAGGGAAGIDTEPLATQALLSNPNSALSDADGNLWIQTNDTWLCVIPKQDGEIYGRLRQAGHIYPILNGNGSDPEVYFIGYSMALERDGHILLSSDAEGLVYRLSAASASTASLTPIGGGGSQRPGTEGIEPLAASLGSPAGVAVDQDGNIAVGSEYPAQVTLLCHKAARIFGIEMVADKSYRLDESAFGNARPKRLAFDRDGNLYFVSSADHSVRRFDRKSGALSLVSGQPGATSAVKPIGNDGPAAAASFQYPVGIAISSDNRLFVSDNQNHQIRLLHL